MARRSPIRRPPLVVVLIVCQLGILGGCGDSRAPSPGLTTAVSAGAFKTLSYPRSGISFRAPSNWHVVAQSAPLLTVVTSGLAVVAVWRYPRSGPVPSGPAALEQAREALISASKGRDRQLQVLSSTATKAGGNPAVQLEVIERISGAVRRVRSTHVFTSRQEVVLEEYAPVNQFASVDRAVFGPVADSLRVSSVA